MRIHNTCYLSASLGILIRIRIETNADPQHLLPERLLGYPDLHGLALHLLSVLHDLLAELELRALRRHQAV